MVNIYDFSPEDAERFVAHIREQKWVKYSLTFRGSWVQISLNEELK